VLPTGGAEQFIDSLSLTADEKELQETAAACGLELHLPAEEPALPEPIRALENRIFWPQAAGFAL
jgi:hypothetical protein